MRPVSSAERAHLSYSARTPDGSLHDVSVRPRGDASIAVARAFASAFDDAGLIRDDDELDAVAGPEFHEDPRHVGLGGQQAELQPVMSSRASVSGDWCRSIATAAWTLIATRE
jgi:hypothetical protein